MINCNSTTRYATNILIVCTVPFLFWGCAQHVKIKDCSQETVEYDAQKILAPATIYHSRVSTFMVHGLVGSNMKPALGTPSIPLLEDDKGNMIYVFPGVKEYFDMQFEKLFFSIKNRANQNNRFILIVSDFIVDVSNEVIQYNILLFPVANTNNVLRHKAHIKITTEDIKDKSYHKFIDMDFTDFYNQIKSKIEDDINRMFNKKAKQLYKN